MAEISQNVNIEMLEKLPDGTYKRKYPKTTKEQVGLDNVDNVKQMPISGGVLENYKEKVVDLGLSSEATIDLSEGHIFYHIPKDNASYIIIGDNISGGEALSFTIFIDAMLSTTSISFPSNVKWQGGEIPDMSERGFVYVLTFVKIGLFDDWHGMYGGEF